jgi:hypothetical protein
MTWVSAAVTVLVTPEKTSEFGVSRYKVWSCRKDSLHVLCADRSAAFEALPIAIRNVGPGLAGPREKARDYVSHCVCYIW